MRNPWKGWHPNRTRWLAGLLLLGCCVALCADELPRFDEFRRVDRMRRLTGQLQTADLLRITQVNGPLLMTTARAHGDDWEAQWGAAELLVEWERKVEFFERALAASATNQAVAFRFAAAAARQREDERAFAWLRIAADRDQDSIVPWVVEIWLRHQRTNTPGEPVGGVLPVAPPSYATLFHDHVAATARARIHLLELAGYSPYAARRLGFMAEAYATAMAHDLAQLSLADSVRPLLLTAGRAMQESPTFLLTELVGQTLELAALKRGDDRPQPEVRYRATQLSLRRERIRELIQVTGAEVVEIANEQEMIAYFDDLLVQGEERAMQSLRERVERPSGP